MSKVNVYLASKPRYEILDGLRGVAALIGAALFFFAGAAFPQTLQTPGWKFALCLVMGLLMIPCGTRLDIRGWGVLKIYDEPVRDWLKEHWLKK